MAFFLSNEQVTKLTLFSGGMGLTGGIADVGGLVDCLVGIAKGYADDRILDEYDRVRRDIYHKAIDPISTENLKRLNRQDPETALENDDFFQMCLACEKDHDKSRETQLVSLTCYFADNLLMVR
jgi:2-polyprenyl-6-methoxyphenol hydroxylase-like FAD-dependent oxidoreductase